MLKLLSPARDRTPLPNDDHILGLALKKAKAQALGHNSEENGRYTCEVFLQLTFCSKERGLWKKVNSFGYCHCDR